MTRRALGPFDHLAGAGAAIGVLALAEDIANASSAAAFWTVERLGGGTRVGFVEFETQVSVWAAIATLALLGGLVAGSELLVRRRLVRPWVPPLAVLGLAATAFTLLIMDPETGFANATIMGVGPAMVVAVAFTAWWMTSRGLSYIRGRGSPVPGMHRAE